MNLVTFPKGDFPTGDLPPEAGSWIPAAVDETTADTTPATPNNPATSAADATPAGTNSGSAADSNTTATAEVETFQVTELDLPETTSGILVLLIGLTALFGLTIRTSLRDSRFLRRSSQWTLLVPRLLVLICVLAIMLNPRQRTQFSRTEASRVAVAIDTSLSMQWPAADDDETAETRSDAVIRQLVTSGLLGELSKTHVVSVYGFSETTRGPLAVIRDGEVRFVDPDDQEIAAESSESSTPRVTLDATEDNADAAALDSAVSMERWKTLLSPRGRETRLGEATYELLGQLTGRTLSGIVVITDGGMNAGLPLQAAADRAERTSTQVIAVGVGNRQPQPNFWITGMQAPPDVHRGDPFDVTVMLQGTGLETSEVTVRLFQQSAGGDGSDRQEVAVRQVELESDAASTKTVFPQSLDVAGKYEYVARVEAPTGTMEMTIDDNERRRAVEVTDERMQVLVMSSGPMRDYQFVRNSLFRHSGIDSDVWLQSMSEENAGMVSQESRKLLTQFPRTEAELFDYDVIVAFDPDWSRLSVEQHTFLNRWVSEHAGGLVVVAGELYTPQLAEQTESLRDISVLYPVLLSRMAPDLALTQRADEPWPVLPTAEGRVTEYLQLSGFSDTSSGSVWEQFRGIYRSYPIRGLRDGAITLLEYDNPRARTDIGVPPFLVGQFYGAGRTVFIGSAETWRLRQISSEAHQQFWTGLIREAGQGRRSRGSARGVLLLDRTEATPGQPVTIRAQLYNAELQPLSAADVPLRITDPTDALLNIPDRLRTDGRGLGQFRTTFRAESPGQYTITVPVPESTDELTAVVDVVLPSLESVSPQLNTMALDELIRDTSGTVLFADEISRLTELLRDESQPVVVDEQLRTLWDRQWLMILACCLLGFEWAARRWYRLS